MEHKASCLEHEIHQLSSKPQDEDTEIECSQVDPQSPESPPMTDTWSSSSSATKRPPPMAPKKQRLFQPLNVMKKEEADEQQNLEQKTVAQYLMSGRMNGGNHQGLLTGFALALGSASLNIQAQEQNEDTGILSISVRVNSGVITANLDELFEQNPTHARALHASLAWASTFIAVMAVKSLRTLYPERIDKLAAASFIRWDLEEEDNPQRRATLLIPKGEFQFLKYKAEHVETMTEEWWKQLAKPMQCYLQTEVGEWSMNKHTMVLERNRRKYVDESALDKGEVQDLISQMHNLFYYFAVNALSAKEMQREFYLKRLRGSSSNSNRDPTPGSGQPSTSQEYWYFRRR